MSSKEVVIIGSGGHAKVVIELVRAEGKYQIKGCTGLGERGFVLGDIPILGSDSVLPAMLANGARKAFVAIGDNHLRLRLLAQVSEMGFEIINAVSPNAVVSPSATLGRGIAIMAGAIIKDEEKCIRCALCAQRCPTHAITMEALEQQEREVFE